MMEHKHVSWDDARELIKRVLKDAEICARMKFEKPADEVPLWLPQWHKRRLEEVAFDLLEIADFERIRALLLVELRESRHPNFRWMGVRTMRKVEQVGIPKNVVVLVKSLADYVRAAAAGSERGLEHLAGRFAVQGRKKSEKLREVHAEKYGTRQEREARNAQMQKLADEVRLQNPKWTKERIKNFIAKKFHVSAVTVNRYCEIAPPKK